MGCASRVGFGLCSDEADEGEEDEEEEEDEESDDEEEEEARTNARGGATAQSSDSEGEDAAGGVRSTFVRHLEHELSAAQVR